MKPVLFELGPLTVYSFGVFIALGFATGFALTYWLARRRGLPTNNLVDYFLYAAVAGLVGARLWHVLFKPAEVRSAVEIFSLWGGGLSLYGGLALAIAALVLVWRRQRQPIWQWLDILAVSTPVGLAVGKIGSFLAGDSFGRSSQLPWAVQFNDPQAPGYIMGTPLHPTQLYAAVGYLVSAAVLYRVLQRASRPGLVFWAGLVLLALVQLLVEIWHAPIDALYLSEGVRMVTVVSLIIVAVGVTVLWFSRKPRRRGV